MHKCPLLLINQFSYRCHRIKYKPYTTCVLGVRDINAVIIPDYLHNPVLMDYKSNADPKVMVSSSTNYRKPVIFMTFQCSSVIGSPPPNWYVTVKHFSQVLVHIIMSFVRHNQFSFILHWLQNIHLIFLQRMWPCVYGGGLKVLLPAWGPHR